MTLDLKKIRSEVSKTLKNADLNFVDALLNQCQIVESPEETIAYIDPNTLGRGAVITLGQGFSNLPKKEQIGVVVHEVLHIPQIKVKDFIDSNYNYSKQHDKLKDNEELLLKFCDRDSNVFKSFKHRSDNIGMDAEVNEYIEDKIGIKMEHGIVPSNIKEYCQTLSKDPITEITKEGLDFDKYVQYAIDNTDIEDKEEDKEEEDKEEDKEEEDKEEEDKEDGDDEGDEDGDSSSGKGKPSNKGESNLNPEDWEAVLDEMIDAATQELVQLIKEGGLEPSQEDKKSVGTVAGMDLMKIKKGLNIPRPIEAQLEKIERKIKPIRGEKDVPTYSWSRRHSAFPGKKFPALIETPFITMTQKIVVVMDSSASCWDADNFKLGIAIAEWFDRKKLLACMYTCDVRLRRVDSLKKPFDEVCGGGGTAFDKTHVEEIIFDVGEDITILYLTDGGLDLSDANNRKETHVMVCMRNR